MSRFNNYDYFIKSRLGDNIDEDLLMKIERKKFNDIIYEYNKERIKQFKYKNKNYELVCTLEKDQLIDSDNIDVELLEVIKEEGVKNIISDYNNTIQARKENKKIIDFILNKNNYVNVDDFKYLHLNKNDKLVRINNIADDSQNLFDVMFLNPSIDDEIFEYGFDFDNIFIKFKNEDKFTESKDCNESNYIFDYISFMI